MEISRVNVPLRSGGKKMRKRKELDALVSSHHMNGGGGVGGGGRGSGGKSCKHGFRCRQNSSGISSQDQLLSVSSDEDYGNWSGKEVRNPCRTRILIRKRACSSFLRACTLMLVLACVAATTAIMWLFIDIRQQATYLRNELDQVVAGNQGIPDALQKCHSLSRELQQNQTDLRNRFNILSAQLANFSKQMTTIGNGLFDVEQRLRSSPELVNVPKILEDVASLGSKVNDYVTTTDQLKQTTQNLEKAQHIIESNITALKQNLTTIRSAPNILTSETEKHQNEEKEKVLNRIKKVEDDIKAVNETLSEKLQWAVNDQIKDHSAIENLQTVSQNVSAQVTTLQGVCSSQVLNNLSTSVQKMQTEFVGSMKQLSSLKSQVAQILDKEKIAQDHRPVLSSTDTSQSATTNLGV
nr:PREDICTED: uncharacterized protein LOC109039725 isoform X1 [Bemisia tabaci]